MITLDISLETYMYMYVMQSDLMSRSSCKHIYVMLS